MNKAAIAVLATVAAAAPLAAQEHVFVESSAVKDKPVITLAPDRAYVMIRAAGQTAFMLMKDADTADQAEYDRLRGEAFAEEQERYAKKVKKYGRDFAAFANAPAGRRGPQPEKPIELTEANFAFTPFQLMTQVSVGPVNRLSNAKGNSVYLTELTPGSYRLYGPVMEGQQGKMGACFCMGSVRFTVRPGEITDLGSAVSPEAIETPPGDSSYPLVAAAGGGYRIAPASADMAIDPRLQGKKITPATYRPAGKLPNFFGLPIARLAPMPGVFAYDRDRIVDLTGGAAADGR